MTGTTATSLRQKEASAIRSVVVCDDREVMRLGLVEMLQAMRWASDLKGFSSLPLAWTYLAASSAPSAIAILGGASAAKDLEAMGRPSGPPAQVVVMLRDTEAAHLAVAAGLPSRWLLPRRRPLCPRCSALCSPGSMSVSSRCRRQWPSSSSASSAARRARCPSSSAPA